ncbi:hypothetical protein QUB80_19815 [Chlorogloeopsis sp. ULAP01]|uniref:hypothetical protein n=1 Tax=Chlorogloeopsis sp. ULAP01 TaxID=3056483 RepID=UPI0025AB5BD5|nr:hypothetical protein [Chlorogloeopsis sp. ULAP01]MDM9382944.1 hypothetical protein [Chlorogloeopsis sp. ULAP01]
MDEKNQFSNFDLQQIAKLPAEIAAFAEKYPTDILNTVNFRDKFNFSESYVPELIEIYYGNIIHSDGSDISIMNGQLKHYKISNVNSNIQSIAVEIDGECAYIEVEGKEIINRLSGLVLPDVVIEPSILLHSVLKGDKVAHQGNREVLTDLLDLSKRQSHLNNVYSISVNIQSELNQVEVSQQFLSPSNTSVESFQQQLYFLEQQLQEQQKIIYALNIQKPSEIILNLCFDLGKFKQIFEQQKEKIELLKQELENVINCSNHTVKHSQLQNWISSVEIKVQQIARNSYNQIITVLIPKCETLKSQLEVQVKELKNKIKQQLTNW